MFGQFYLLIVTHDLVALIGAKLEVVNSAGEIKRTLQLISHLISWYLAPHMRLPPVYPCASHFKWIITNVGWPWSATDTVTGFHEEYFVTCWRVSSGKSLFWQTPRTCKTQISSCCQAWVPSTNNDSIPWAKFRRDVGWWRDYTNWRNALDKTTFRGPLKTVTRCHLEWVWLNLRMWTFSFKEKATRFIGNQQCSQCAFRFRASLNQLSCHDGKLKEHKYPTGLKKRESHPCHWSMQEHSEVLQVQVSDCTNYLIRTVKRENRRPAYIRDFHTFYGRSWDGWFFFDESKSLELYQPSSP
jgi:hypothetical protein